MLVITGSTGQLGQDVIKDLVKYRSPKEIIALTRSKDKAQNYIEQGIEVREFDFSNKESIVEGFKGADELLLISSNAVGNEVDHHRNAIEAAKETGIQHIYYTSHTGSKAKSHFSAMEVHYATEQLLEESGIPFTSIRNGFYAESGSQFFFEGIHDGVLYVPENAPVNWTTHEDLAEGMVQILIADDFTEKYPNLTTHQLVSLKEAAEQYKGADITYQEIPDQKYVDILTENHVPESIATFLVGIFAASRDNEFTKIDNTLEQLIGRKPKTLIDVVNENSEK